VRISTATLLFCALLFAETLSGVGYAQTGNGGNGSPPPAGRTATPKFTFILFWKEDNAATQDMAAKLTTAVEKRTARVEWAAININDPANQATVDRYKVSRAPMPMAVCVAPNGAVTGFYTNRISDEAVEQALVTPTMTSCMKAMQEGKMVLVHGRLDDRSALPNGAAAFASDAAFQARTTVVSFRLDDAQESRFVTELGVPANSKAPVVALLAPPGVLVGKFAESSTKDQIAAALHAAGKCCDDENCKHNQNKSGK